MSETIRFTRLGPDRWGVKVPDVYDVKGGDTVTVFKRDGSTTEVVLGTFQASDRWGSTWSLAPRRQEQRQERQDDEEEGLTPITEPGAFRFGGEVYVVRPTKDGERLYAKRVVEIQGDRLNELDEVVQIELEYQRGAMAFLREEHRLSEEEGKALSLRYGRCIICGRRLKAAQSVEAGIGPVCRTRFRGVAA